jgi:glycosyltransferase involved in cell wall biosynthesis
MTPHFSICVPTYNRGRCATTLVDAVLPRLPEGFEILVIDNASWRETEAYAALAARAAQDPRLRYVRNPVNVFFAGNYLNCFRMARADALMIVSDEDLPNLDLCHEALTIFADDPEAGIIRGGLARIGTPADSNDGWRPERRRHAPGLPALIGFGFVNNYVSGTVYRRSHVPDDILDRVAGLVDLHRDYPHLLLELLVLAHAGAHLVPTISAWEGAEQHTGTASEAGGNTDLYCFPYTYGSRIDQHLVLRDAMRLALHRIGGDIPLDRAIHMYLRLVNKTLRLISDVNGRMYRANGIRLPEAVRAATDYCIAAMPMPEFAACRDDVAAEIRRHAATYQPILP